MKSYENNMADQDVIVHSLRVLSDIKNPALTQLKRDINSIKNSAISIATRTDKFWQALSEDDVITPLEKKIIKREMENIANSYTALYTQAVAEHYETAEFFTDYMATYNALRNYLYYTIKLFDNMEENTEVDRDEFNEFFSDYYYSENFAIVSMTVGVIANIGFKVLTSLEDEGEEGEIGLYLGALYQYIDDEWKIINRELYFGKSAVLPPEMQGRYFLCTADVLLDDYFYVNDDPLELNGEILKVYTQYNNGIIYVFEDNTWLRKEPDEDYRYLVAIGDYYSIKNALPEIMKEEVISITRNSNGTDYYGPLTVPPQNPNEGDFFLYIGETSAGEDPEWIKYELYIYRNGDWERLDEDEFQNRDYFMRALQDILTNAPATTGYFSTAFCNAFFANQASINALSTKVIYLDVGGVIRSKENEYSPYEHGLMIDAEGNIDANENTHIGGFCNIDGNVNIGGNTSISGDMDFGGNVNLSGRTVITGDAHFTGDIDSGPLYLSSTSPTPITITYHAGEEYPERSLYDGHGTFGNISFTKYEVRISHGSSYRLVKVKFYNGTSLVYSDEHNTMNTRFLLPYNFTFTYNMDSDTKTLKLRNLPTTQPVESDVVWNDNGTLKVT